MKILVFNAGSASLKFGVFDMRVADCRVFKDGQCVLHYHQSGLQALDYTPTMPKKCTCKTATTSM